MELKIMFKKIALAVFMLFFLLGTHDLAAAETKPQAKSVNSSQDTQIKAEQPFKYLILPGAAGLLIIIGCGSYWLIYRRKHA